MTEEEGMTLIEHLDELRKVLVRSLLAILVGAAISFIFFESFLMELIKAPIEGKNLDLVQLTVTEAFLTKIKVSLLAGVVLTIPFIAWQIWSFILPALYAKERKYIYIITPFTVLLFAVGVIFGYFAVLPIALVFFIGQGGQDLVAMLSIAKYVSFILGFLLPFGLIFQLPLAVIFLVRTGIVDYKFFVKKRKYAYFIFFVISAILTPADIVSQLLMAGPVILLYEISIIISWIIRKRKKTEEEVEDE